MDNHFLKFNIKAVIIVRKYEYLQKNADVYGLDNHAPAQIFSIQLFAVS